MVVNTISRAGIAVYPKTIERSHDIELLTDALDGILVGQSEGEQLMISIGNELINITRHT